MPPHSALLSQLYRLTSPPPSDAELLRRWVERRDEDAFTALVSRHGRMVHGVCRRVLGNRQDAEDAFQAVFLILARKAAAIRHPEALPGWLHGVAVRLAYKSRTAAARRRCAGADSSVCEPRDPHPDPLEALSARELLVLIDREIARLPEVYRLPLVLCDLEERTQTEAASLLGWTLGSLRGRLLRGRERLRARLARRGLAPAVLAAAFVQGTADALLLTANVGRLAVRFATCPTASGVSPAVAALVRQGIRGLVLTKLKLASAVLLAASTLVASAGLLTWPKGSPTPPRVEERADNQPPSTPSKAKPRVRRDQAGDPLPAEAISRLGTVRFRHGDFIRRLAFGPDSKMLVSHGRDGIRFWNTATGEEIQRFPEQSNAESMALSPDGKLLAIRRITNRIGKDNSKEKGFAIRDFATGRLLRHFGDWLSPWSIVFSPDGKILAAHFDSLDIELWDPTSGRRLLTLKGHARVVGSILTVGPDEVCRLNDLATGKELAVLHGHESPFPFALSPDGKTLASVNANKEVRFLDPATDAVRHTLTKVKSYVLGMTFSADGRTLVVWDAEFIVTFWDAAMGRLQRRLTATESGIPAPSDERNGLFHYAAALSPDGKLLAFGVIGSKRDILSVLETTRGKVVRRITTAEDGAFWMKFSPDSKSLAWGGPLSATVYLGEIASGQVRQRFEGHKGQINSLVFSADGKMLLSGSVDTTAFVWDLTGRLTLGQKFDKALSAEELATHWKTLVAEDAAAAYRAMQALAADPSRSIPYLRARLHPVIPAGEKRLPRWIADLDSEQFTVRQKATLELEKLGATALHAVRKALDEKPALETRRRLEQLIEKQEREEWRPSAENLRTRRALEVLERAGTAEAKDVLTTLANGAPGAWQTRDARSALQRLAHRPTGKR